MQEVRLTVKKRAFPSQGRVRLNIAHLPTLGICEGEHVDLVNEATKKSVTVAVIADTMVRQGHIRMSEEDLKTIGLQDEDDVLVRKTQTKQEKMRKAADAGVSISKEVGHLEETIRKTAGKVKTDVTKAAGSLNKKTEKVSENIGTEAAKTTGKVKKTVKKAIRTEENL